MSLKVLGAGVFLSEELRNFAIAPGWRKASRNMIMVTESLLRASRGLDLPSSDMSLVVGSLSGELDASAEFLMTWSKTQMARPLLFQNSLHNATTGFAAIQKRLTGPTFSISADENTPEECLEMAELLLREGLAKTCAVTLVEVHHILGELIQVTDLAEGACSLIVTLDEQSASERTIPKPYSKLNYRMREAPLLSICDSGFYGLAEKWK